MSILISIENLLSGQYVEGTGIPTIVKSLSDNGSPPPIFDANEPERTHFIVEIPIHSVFADQDTDQDTDQDADQDKTAVNASVLKGIQDLSKLIEEEENAASDQDKLHFRISSTSLLELLKKIYGAREPDEKLIAKCKESALSINDEQVAILKFTDSPKSNKEIQEEALGLKTHTDNYKNHIEPLLNKGFIRRTIPNKPTSKLQKYFTTERGRVVISIREELIKD